MSEFSNYKNNFQEFVNGLQDCYIEKLVYVEDLEPTFDKASLPFEFRYCFSTTFVTDKGSFLLHTSQTSLGYETFWIDSNKAINKATSERLINSKVKTVSSQNKYTDLPYKLSIELEKGILNIYAAEIYDDADKMYTIKVNDEMVFVFDDNHEAKKFEESITTANMWLSAILVGTISSEKADKH